MALFSSRRSCTLASLLTAGTALFVIHLVLYREGGLSSVPYLLPTEYPSRPASASTSHGEINLAQSDPGVRRRIKRMKGLCKADNVFEAEYGRTNLRMSRGYEGMLLSAI